MKKIKKILIGTHNTGKFREISDLLPSKIEKISPLKLKIKSPVEYGKTFKENSEIKANFFCKKSNLITISDDSGLEVESLNKKPGIFSARWAKNYGSFDKAMSKILKKIKKKDKGSRAQFVCSLSIKWPSGKIITEIGIIKGNISSNRRGKNGFGYDPIFIPKGYDKTFAEMKYKEKLLLDHRFIAYKKLEKKIKTFLK